MKILDRYIVSELLGPLLFGLSAFTLIFTATTLLAISRLVASAHPPLWAVVEYFIWKLPSIVVLVIPMAMLMGVLLSLQRLSGDSEITALKAGGIGLVRIVIPILITGFAVSVVALVLQEGVVPFANDRATDLLQGVIQQVGPFSSGNLTVQAKLPGGARQLTAASSYEPSTQTLLDVTVIQYDATGRPQLIIFSQRAQYHPPSWRFVDAKWYYFYPDGSTAVKEAPEDQVDIGERPSDLVQRAADDNPDNMSRAEIREVLTSNQLTATEIRAYQSSYEEKLARPFASFVFTLLAVPFGLRPARGGGGTGLGFGLTLLIVFVYFVVASIVSAVFAGLAGGYTVAVIGAWLPNAIFTAIGVVLLARAARS
ncbi:MAG TPA: LptF/LptG family permease [Candidatus Baltobacteraceae bacterium]